MKADPVLGNLLFITYVFFVILVALNLFVGIVSGHFEKVQESLVTERHDDILFHAAKKVIKSVSATVASGVDKAASYMPPVVKQAALSAGRSASVLLPPAGVGSSRSLAAVPSLSLESGMSGKSIGVTSGLSTSPHASTTGASADVPALVVDGINKMQSVMDRLEAQLAARAEAELDSQPELTVVGGAGAANASPSASSLMPAGLSEQPAVAALN